MYISSITIFLVALLIMCLLILFCLINKNDIVLYETELIYEPIKLKYIKKFLTNNECNHIINISKDKFFKSMVINGLDDTVTNNQRTSYSYYIPRSADNIIKDVELKIINYMNNNVNNGNWAPLLELLQIVKYEEGQEFKEHYDWFQNEYLRTINDNQRHYTFFVYLNDVENGGETTFPKINKTFTPKKGDSLFWENCSTPNNCYTDALHKGKPPLKGIKYGLNVWIRFKPI